MVGPPGSSREQQQEEGGAAGERGPLSRRKPGWLSEGRVLTEGAADAALVGRSQGAGQSTPSPPRDQGKGCHRSCSKLHLSEWLLLNVN